MKKVSMAFREQYPIVIAAIHWGEILVNKTHQVLM
jgi:hypothetical protein